MKRQDTKIMSDEERENLFESDIYGCQCKKDRNLIMLIIFAIGLLIGLIVDDISDRAEKKRNINIHKQAEVEK